MDKKTPNNNIEEQINKLLDNLESALIENKLTDKQKQKLLQITYYLPRSKNALFTNNEMIIEIVEFLDWILRSKRDSGERDKEVKDCLDYILKIIKRYNPRGFERYK